MQVKKIGKLYKATADESMWLTFYTAEQDIVLYDDFNSILTTSARIALLNEITEEQHLAYLEAKEIALNMTGEGNGEGGE